VAEVTGPPAGGDVPVGREAGFGGEQPLQPRGLLVVQFQRLAPGRATDASAQLHTCVRYLPVAVTGTNSGKKKPFTSRTQRGLIGGSQVVGPTRLGSGVGSGAGSPCGARPAAFAARPM
jgi:hypothetical protein